MMKMKKSDIVKEIEAYSLRSAEPYKRWVKEVRGLQNTAVKIEEAYKAGWKDGRVSASAYGPDSDWKRWNTKATELGDEVMKHKHAENMKLFAEDALETDNPWPEGVLVDCRLRGLKHKAAETSAEYLIWQISGGMTDIIASCCAGLQEGWSYD
jgi:hypothetical protein